MAEETGGKFSGDSLIGVIVGALLASVKSSNKVDKVAEAVVDRLNSAYEKYSNKSEAAANRWMDGFFKAARAGVDKGIKSFDQSFHSKLGQSAQGALNSIHQGIASGVQKLTPLLGKASAAWKEFSGLVGGTQFWRYAIAAPFVAAIDTVQDLRRTMVESADIMGDRFQNLTHMMNAMLAQVTLSQRMSVRVLESFSSLGILATHTTDQIVDLGVHVGRMNEYFYYSTQVLAETYNHMSKLGVSVKGYIKLTKDSYKYGKMYNLSLEEQQYNLQWAQKHMQSLGRTGDAAGAALIHQFARASGYLKALTGDAKVSAAFLEKMGKFSEQETIRSYTIMAAHSGRTTRDLMDMYRNNMDEFVATSTEASTHYINRMISASGGLAKMIEGTLDPIVQDRILGLASQHFGTDKPQAYMAMVAKVREEMASLEKEYEAAGRAADFRLRQEELVQQAFENQGKKLREALDAQAEFRASTADFDKNYAALKSTHLEMMASLKNIGHALLVTIGTPVIRVFHEILEMLRPIVDGLGWLVTKFSEAVSKSKALQAIVAGIVIGLTGLLFPILQTAIIFGLVVKVADELFKLLGLGGVWGVLRMVGKELLRIGTIVWNAVVLPVKVVVWLWKAVTGALREAWELTKVLFTPALYVANLLFKKAKEIWGAVSAWGTELLESSEVLKAIRATITTIGGWAKSVKGWFSGWGKETQQAQREVVKVSSTLKKESGGFANWYLSSMEKVINGYKAAWTALGSPVDAFKLGMSYLEELVDRIKGRFQTLGALIKDLIWLPIKNASNTLVWAVQKALSFLGMASDPGELKLEQRKGVEQTLRDGALRDAAIQRQHELDRKQNHALHQKLSGIMKEEGYLGRKDSKKASEAIVRELNRQSPLRYSEVSPFSKKGKDRRMALDDGLTKAEITIKDDAGRKVVQMPLLRGKSVEVPFRPGADPGSRAGVPGEFVSRRSTADNDWAARNSTRTQPVQVNVAPTAVTVEMQEVVARLEKLITQADNQAERERLRNQLEMFNLQAGRSAWPDAHRLATGTV